MSSACTLICTLYMYQERSPSPTPWIKINGKICLSIYLFIFIFIFLSRILHSVHYSDLNVWTERARWECECARVLVCSCVRAKWLCKFMYASILSSKPIKYATHVRRLFVFLFWTLSINHLLRFCFACVSHVQCTVSAHSDTLSFRPE